MTDLVLSPQSLLLGGLTGYMIGSIPFAYIVTKRRTGMDIRKYGTGNVGAANTLQVTGQRTIARTVLVLDMLKGFLPVAVFELLGLSAPLVVLLPALILGHCYPVWLGFRGGRGLATATGALLLVNPGAVFLWCVTYMIGKRIKPDIRFASILATGLALAVVLGLPADFLGRTTLPFSGLSDHGTQVFLSLSVVLLIILSRHIGPFLELIGVRNSGE
ncbi:MAG: glycerol-3-phosphate acyltransferase [Bacteroidota bacterium]|nr:glycerol-3-phosphate acyltransferase [Bacteroidota bacterium]MDP4232009.1 glycerol-3-phosphate acyltransferase [Bacteroidota bacterium]MDP4241284.1 glycerol-3-phosphate acyltransferase [Bacteroidota bacterium]MDP4286676.1 glycerol-3-phosphate acyltransferase [Bacteroidota bacterium]